MRLVDCRRAKRLSLLHKIDIPTCLVLMMLIKEKLSQLQNCWLQKLSQLQPKL